MLLTRGALPLSFSLSFSSFFFHLVSLPSFSAAAAAAAAAVAAVPNRPKCRPLIRFPFISLFNFCMRVFF